MMEGMSSARRAVMLVLVLATVQVASADPAKLAPPPDGPDSGPARTIGKFFDMYYQYAQDPEFCILSVRSAADSFKRNAEAIAQLTGPEQKTFEAYFKTQLVPYFARTSGGVEGMGTYNELVAKRLESQAWLTEHAPKGPASTPAEIGTYAAAERAYLERAAADSVWVEKAFAESPCLRWAARRTNELPALGDFGIYRRSWVAEPAARAKVRDLRAKLLPSLTAHRQAVSSMKNLGRGPFRAASDLGTALLVMASAVKNIDAENPKAELLQVWVKALDPTESALVAQELAGRAEARAEAVAWFAAKFALMGMPPAATDQRAAGDAKALGATAKALAVRVLSPMATFSENRTEFGDKVFSRAVHFAGKTFTFAQVVAGAPWKDWPADLGGPGTCSLVILTAMYYSAGANVALGKWELHSDTAYPIPCARKTATYTPE